MSASIVNKEAPKSLVIAAFAAIYIIWGSTYLAILIAIKNIPPFLMAGARFLTAGLLLFAWCRLRGATLPASSSLRKISFGGILMLFFGTGTVVWVEQYISSGLAAIIVAALPLWFVVLDKRQWKFHFSNRRIIAGLLVGFAGVLLLFADSKSFSFAGDKMKIISFFVLMGGTVSWAIGSLYSKYTPVEGSPAMKAAIQMMAAGAASLIAGFISGEHHRFAWSNIHWQAVVAFTYLITIGSLVGYMAYVWLLGVRSAAMVGTYAYVNPAVAVFLGWLIAGEQISRQQLIALAVILLGVLLVSLPGFKNKSNDSKNVARKSADSKSGTVSPVPENKRAERLSY